MNGDGLMRATLEIYKVRHRPRWGKKKAPRKGPGRQRPRYQWRLIAGNGEKLARGSQALGFATVRSCWRNASHTALALAGTYGELLPTTYPAPGETVVRTNEQGHELTITRAA